MELSPLTSVLYRLLQYARKFPWPVASDFSDADLWWITQVFDYAVLAIMCWMAFLLQGFPEDKRPIAVLALSHLVLGALVTGAMYLRELVYFSLLDAKLPEEKRKSSILNPRTLSYVFQTYLLAQSTWIIMNAQGLVYYTPPELSFDFLASLYVPFLLLLVLRDSYLLPMHHLMHVRWYPLHKTHHEVRKDAQSLHGYHIDALDLCIENVLAPFMLLCTQYLLGYRVGMHWFVGIMLTFHDGNLHSINPYSVSYFNPIMDYFMYPNVCHQLHHALNKGYLMFVPYHHAVSQEALNVDLALYNRTFGTVYEF